jgi:hypothetical protein
MVQQATGYINAVGASMEKTSAYMQQAGEDFQSAVRKAELRSRMGTRRKPNGYDGDTEGVVPDRRTGPKPTKMLNIHV